MRTTGTMRRALEAASGAARIAVMLPLGPCLVEPVGLVMSRKMLRTITRLAETRPAATAAAPRAT